MKKYLFYGISLLGILIWQSCKETIHENIIPRTTPPANPYDTLTYPNDTIVPIVVDSATFMGLHNNIFSKKCNQPACHDGTFEPDFRTVQSAYNSLVYQDILKNYTSNPLAYRVKPSDTAQSMLWHRVSRHNPPNYERMPSSGNPLSESELHSIATWILGGAKDIYGNNPSVSSLQPTPFGVVAYSALNNDARVDSSRGGVIYQPFMVATGDTLDLWLGYLDRTPAGDTVLGDVLTYNKIKFSRNPFDFSASPELTMTKENLLTARYLALYLGQTIPFPIPYTHHIQFIPAAHGFVAGDIVYFRTYVRDSDHATATETPENDSQYYIISYFSMILQ